MSSLASGTSCAGISVRSATGCGQLTTACAPRSGRPPSWKVSWKVCARRSWPVPAPGPEPPPAYPCAAQQAGANRHRADRPRYTAPRETGRDDSVARRRLPIGIRTSVEYDAAGEPAATGGAARAVFYSEREDPSVAGAIRLRSESQGVSLEAQSLRWEGLRHRLVSEQEVVIARDDGSEVRAGGVGRGHAPQADPLHRSRERPPGHRRRRGGRGVTASPCRGGGTARRLR